MTKFLAGLLVGFIVGIVCMWEPPECEAIFLREARVIKLATECYERQLRELRPGYPVITKDPESKGAYAFAREDAQ